MTPRVTVVPGSVRKVCQLTGERDVERGGSAYNRTEYRFSLYGTDLGASFMHDGRLWFLFGDTWPSPQNRPTDHHDSIASTTDTGVAAGVRLEFVTRHGRYGSPALTDTDGRPLGTGEYEVPVAGFSADGQMYVFHSTEHVQETLRAGGLHAAWPTPDGAISVTWANPGVDGGRWRRVVHSTAPGQVSANGGVTAVTRRRGGVDVCWVAPTGAVTTTWSNPAVQRGAWHQPFPISSAGAALPGTSVALVTRFDGALDVFWTAPDGSVMTAWSNPAIGGGSWRPPFAITPPLAAARRSPLGVVTRLDGVLDVFWVTRNGAVATTSADPRVDGGRWQPAFAITAPGTVAPGTPLTALTRLDGALDVFWSNPNGAIASTWANPRVDSGRWHTPFAITGPQVVSPAAPVAAVTRLEGALDVFWATNTGAIATTWANPTIDAGRWHRAFTITASGAARAGAPVAAVTRLDGALDVCWTTVTGALATTWANPRVDGGRWQPVLRFTGDGAVSATTTAAVVVPVDDARRPIDLMGRSVLAEAIGNDPLRLRSVYRVSRLADGGRFINVACTVVGDGVSQLPWTSPTLLVWGSGRYRDSDVYLAAVPLAEVRSRHAWRYYAGNDPVSGALRWHPSEAAAVAVVRDRQVGELSVVWVASLGVWLLLYNAMEPFGIVARVAEHPWGPWSGPVLAYDPASPEVGFGRLLHVGGGPDLLSDPGREDESGGPYGPYLIDRYTEPVAADAAGRRGARIHFVLSTWNPYNTVLMTAVIRREPDTP